MAAKRDPAVWRQYRKNHPDRVRAAQLKYWRTQLENQGYTVVPPDSEVGR